MAMRLLTDEHVGPKVSRELIELGFEVTCLRDRGLLHAEDWEIMRWCVQHGNIIATKNETDFEEQHEHFQRRGEEHPGILILGGEWENPDILAALRQFLEGDPDPVLLRNHVHRLPPATSKTREGS